MSDIGAARRIAAYYDASYPPELTEPPGGGPVLSTVDPPSVSRTGGPITLTFTGSGFEVGCELWMAGILAPTATRTSDTVISLPNYLPSLIPVGVTEVPFRVRNPDGAESNEIALEIVAL